MPITQELVALGDAARRLADGSDQLNRLIGRIDELLARLMIGIEYFHPRPVAENVTHDRGGKRIIELSFLGYARVGKGFGLAIRTTKVTESKLAHTAESAGETVPLLQAPRRVRYAAVDLLPELALGLGERAEQMADDMERRCATAAALAARLEGTLANRPNAHTDAHAEVVRARRTEPPQAARSGRTLPYLGDAPAAPPDDPQFAATVLPHRRR